MSMHGADLSLAAAAIDARPFRWRMGVRPLDPSDWLEDWPDRRARLAEKEEILATTESFVALGGSEQAGREALELVLAHLRTDHERATAIDPARHPVDQAARLVPEDLCLMEKRTDGPWIMTAGSVCFPTNWDVATKLGQSVAAIHAPVPQFAAQIGGAVDRFFDRLRPETPVWRTNWGLADRGDLRLSHRDDSTAADAGDAAPARRWLRVERQTLRRLVDHAATVFTIGVHRWPLAEVAADPAFCGVLAAALEELPPEVADYKLAMHDRRALAAWLRSR